MVREEYNGLNNRQQTAEARRLVLGTSICSITRAVWEERAALVVRLLLQRLDGADHSAVGRPWSGVRSTARIDALSPHSPGSA